MNKKPLISIIIPIYNVGRYIEKCIQSVLSQTYNNFELILVDDGSPDAAGAICDRYAKTDKRIAVIHKSNGGVSSARNAGLDVAKGDYIMFIDGDDWVDEDHLEYLLSLLEGNNASMAMSYGMHTLEKVNLSDFRDENRLISGVDMAADLLYHKTVIGSCNKLFSRKLIYDNNIRFNENLFIGEGFNFIVMCAQLASTVSTGRKKTYHYRLDNPESAMTKFNIKKIHNNDIALDTIKKDFVVESRKLNLAWNYAKWLTALNFSVWMKLSTSINEYQTDYNRMLHDIRFRAPLVLISAIDARKKLPAIFAIISPRLAVFISATRRKKRR